MSKEVSTNRIALKSSEEQKPIEPWSMDAAADRLMDEVFSDVNRIAESGSEPPVETPETDYVSLKQITYPSISLSPGILPRRLEETDTKDADKDEKPYDEGKSLNKLLLGAACASLAITLLLWLAGQGKLNGLFGITATAPTPTTPKVASQDDSQFIDYVQRSLDVISQKPEEKDNKQVASLPQPPAPNELVPVPVPGNLPENRPPSVLERVYIPVYPRPQPVYVNPVAKPTPTVAASPRPAAQPSPNLTAAARPTPTITTITPPAVKPFPNITAAARPTPSATPSAAATNRPTAKPSPAAPSVAATTRPTAKPSPAAPSVAATTRPTAKPSPTVAAVARPTVAPSPLRAPATASPSATAVAPPAPQPTFRPQPSTQASASTPAIRYTLVGVLVLGEKSAAIFEVGGASRRIHIGESIGSTGWTLVEVGNDEAVIRRNGEVRSVYVGQQF